MKIILVVVLFSFSFYSKSQELDSIHVVKNSFIFFDKDGNTYWARDTLKVKLMLKIKTKTGITAKTIIGYKVIELHNTGDYYNYYFGRNEKPPVGFIPEDYWVLKTYLDQNKKPFPKNVTVWVEK